MIDVYKLDAVTSNIGDMALKRRVKTIIQEMNINDNEAILDCGCGDGIYLTAINEMYHCNLHGFDMDIKNLFLAKKSLRNTSVNLSRGNIYNLPYPDNYFDKIFCSEVLEHIPDDAKAMGELNRVLKKEGLLIITVPNHNYPLLWNPINKLLEKLTGKHIKSGFWAGIWNMHLRLYTQSEIVSLVENAGFEIRNKKALTHYSLPFNHIILHALKRVLNSKILPEGMENTANKFSYKEEKRSALIQSSYFILEAIDRLNDNIFIDKSSVSIFIKEVKI